MKLQQCYEDQYVLRDILCFSSEFKSPPTRFLCQSILHTAENITLTTIINYNEGQFAESLQQLRDNYTTVLQNHISTNMFPQQYYSKRSENKEIGELKTKRINPR